MSKRVLLILVGCLLAFLGLAILQLKISRLKEEKKVLLDKVASADKEINQLKSSLENKERELAAMKKELEVLSDSQRLKKALSASQEMINQLSAEINSLKEKINKLTEESISFKSRAEINAKEVTRLLGELQEAREKIANLESKKELSLVALPVSPQGQDSGAQQELKKELAKLKEDYQELLKERDFLKKNIEKYQKELANKKPSQYWEERVKELSQSLKDKEKEKKELEERILQLKEDKEGLIKKMEEDSARIKELTLLNAKLQEQIVQLTSQLSDKTREYYALEKKLKSSTSENELIEAQERLKIQGERLRTVTYLYNRLKDQLKELSALLSSKDSELEEKDKEIARLKDEISYLKVKAETLQEAYKASEENQNKILERLKQVTDLNTNLQDKLGEVSTLLGEGTSSKKNPLGLQGEVSSADSLEGKNIEELKKKVEVILRSIHSENSSREDFE